MFVENKKAKVINTSTATSPYVNDSDPVRATKISKMHPTNNVTRYPTNKFSNLFIIKSVF